MRNLPVPIQEILRASYNDIDERGELSSECRKLIYQKIEEVSLTERQETAHTRRARLQINCAWKTVNKLSESHPEYNLARDILVLSENLLISREEIKGLEVAMNTLHTLLENLMDEGEHKLIAAYAGFACISAANTAIYDIDLDLAGLPEIELDPDEWTACYYACLAYCGGAVWEKDQGDDMKRREFWEWFLRESIPGLWSQ
jgi:hypothetical protein